MFHKTPRGTFAALSPPFLCIFAESSYGEDFFILDLFQLQVLPPRVPYNVARRAFLRGRNKSSSCRDRGMAVRILLVEDEAELADFVYRGLHEEGYTVSVAPDGEIGWMQLNSATWDLALLDWWVPRCDG